MATNLVGLRTIEQFMNDYKPSYQPMYPLLMGNSQAYPDVVGKLDFKRMEAVGDLRAHILTPKDTEIRQISVSSGEKSFKKYFLANQFTLSSLQDRSGTENVVAQVLDEHQKQMDELVLLGDGTAANNVKNNGLYWSADVNYVLKNSYEVDTDVDSLIGTHAKIIENAADADNISGRKLVLFYGSDVLARFRSVYAATTVAFRKILADTLPDYSFASLPSAVTPSGQNGWMIINLDQVKLHYTVMPKLDDQGTNAEKKYNWFNFLMGSAMVDVLASGAVIRQPITFEA